jgi:hypothetical protein
MSRLRCVLPGRTHPERSPVADALAGLRANEARYFKNKYEQLALPVGRP